MFAPPSDLNLVGYGANLRLLVASRPMTFALVLMRTAHNGIATARSQRRLGRAQRPSCRQYTQSVTEIPLMGVNERLGLLLPTITSNTY